MYIFRLYAWTQLLFNIIDDDYFVFCILYYNRHSYAEQHNVDIRGQTDYVNSLDESRLLTQRPGISQSDQLISLTPGQQRQQQQEQITGRRGVVDGVTDRLGQVRSGFDKKSSKKPVIFLTPSQFEEQYQSSMPSGIGPNDLENILKYHHEYVVSSSIQECHLLVCC